MFDDASKLVNICTKLGITANQFLLCYLLHTDEKVDGKYPSKGRPIANLYKYSSNQNTTWTREEIADLIEKGYLSHSPNPAIQTSNIYPDDLKVEPSFVSQVIANESRFDQLNAIYPFIEKNNGIVFQLKVCDLDKMEKLYNHAVKTVDLHQTILSLIHWAKDNGGINMSLENFIRSQGWNTLRARKDEYDATSYEQQRLG